MSEELLKLIDEANRGQSPSPFGKAEYTILGSPASVQSSRPVRTAYINSIREKFEHNAFILTGEISLEIIWYIPSKSRFETDAKADIDNCLKPIIDAFTGPNGLFVDDCQLRSLHICWRHIESNDERLELNFEFGPDDFCAKKELAFVKLDGALCTPVNLDWPTTVKVMWAGTLKSREKLKAMLEKLGTSYPNVASFLLTSRPFHATRVKEFKILSLTEFIAASSVENL
jgi:Holliday junction resolvase RusA-like endonuclease